MDSSLQTSGSAEAVPDELDQPVAAEYASDAAPLLRPRRARKSVNLLAPLAMVLALSLSPLAMVFGYIAIGQIRRADQRGAAMAWFAISLGWLWCVVLAVVVGSFTAVYLETPLWPTTLD